MFENLIQNLIGEQATEQLSKRTGMNPQAAKSVVNAVLPIIMKSMSGNTKDASNTEKLLQAAGDHNEETIDDVDEEDGKKVAGHLLGDTEKVSQQVAGQLGLDSDQVTKIIAAISPLVLSQINKSQQDGTVDSENLSKTIDKSQSLFDADGVFMKTATALLDSNKDGSIVDDLIKKGMDLLGKSGK